MMHHSIARIAGNPEDYKKCRLCGAVNWYENERCINCGGTEFVEFTEKDAERLLEVFDDEEIEIDV